MYIDKSIVNIALSRTREWIEQVVVGLNLCPFAAQPLMEERVRFSCCTETEMEGILQHLISELSWMGSEEGPQTTLVVIPSGLESFDRFLDLVGAAEDLLIATGWDSQFQLAHFHPDYCFEGSEPTDLANHTNRSPYPVLHLLRVEDVARAIAAHPDTQGIPERNMAVLRDLGAAGLAELLASSPSSD